MGDKDSKKRWVGFDLGGTKMLAVVFDANGKVLGRERKKTRGNEGVKAGLERVVRTIQEALDQAGASPDTLGCIGVGSPGPLDLDRGIVLDTPNLGWKNAPLKEYLEKAFGCPATVINDVDAGVYGEYARGAAKGARCVVGVFPGTGIGGGCVYEGRILRGRRLSCMELGHLPVVPDGPLCGCGRRGCLEAVASRLAIAQAAAAAAFRGEAPHLLEAAGTDIGKIRSGVLAKAIQDGDKVVEDIVKAAAGQIGLAMGGVVNLLAPDVVLLGGGLVEAMPALFTEQVGKALARTAMPSFADTYKVVVAKLGDDAGVIGAAAWARACAERP